jgi:hypothetical protein
MNGGVARASARCSREFFGRLYKNALFLNNEVARHRVPPEPVESFAKRRQSRRESFSWAEHWSDEAGGPLLLRVLSHHAA